jgi:hypothetical protein
MTPPTEEAPDARLRQEQRPRLGLGVDVYEQYMADTHGAVGSDGCTTSPASRPESQPHRDPASHLKLAATTV